jgi:hypothetical protein
MLDCRVYSYLSVCEKHKVVGNLREARKVKENLMELLDYVDIDRIDLE